MGLTQIGLKPSYKKKKKKRSFMLKNGPQVVQIKERKHSQIASKTIVTPFPVRQQHRPATVIWRWWRWWAAARIAAMRWWNVSNTVTRFTLPNFSSSSLTIYTYILHINNCQEWEFQIVALANLLPEDDAADELDSYMYQTVWLCFNNKFF